MAINTITYAVDKIKSTWAYLETVMPATYNEINRVVIELVTNNNALQGLLDLKAPLASPALTGNPTAPTASADSNSTQIATTAWVRTVFQSLISDVINPVKEKVGVIKFYAGTSAPTGYLFCQGQALSRTTYADLYAIVGTTFGTGDGSTTFNLPDLRGVFIRGLGGNSAALGTIQGDAIRNITGTFGCDDKATRIATGAFRAEQQWDQDTSASQGDSNFFKFTFDASRVVPTASENRPVNMAMNYIVKY